MDYFVFIIVRIVQVLLYTLDTAMPALLQGLLTGARYGSASMAEALRYADNDQIRDIARWLTEEKL